MKMCFGRQIEVRLEVTSIDVKNFPDVRELPHFPTVSADTIDLVRCRLKRAREDLQRIYNERQSRDTMPLYLRSEQDVDQLASLVDKTIPVMNEYIRLRETLQNFEAISKSHKVGPSVLWMAVTATFGGSKDPKVLQTSVKESERNFSWDERDIRSNITLRFKKCFPFVCRKPQYVEEELRLKFYLSHCWRPQDERAVQWAHPSALSLAYAELDLKGLCLRKKTVTLKKTLPMLIEGKGFRALMVDRLPQ